MLGRRSFSWVSVANPTMGDAIGSCREVESTSCQTTKPPCGLRSGGTFRIGDDPIRSNLERPGPTTSASRPTFSTMSWPSPQSSTFGSSRIRPAVTSGPCPIGIEGAERERAGHRSHFGVDLSIALAREVPGDRRYFQSEKSLWLFAISAWLIPRFCGRPERRLLGRN